jgi:hypothetical protein
MSSPQGAITVRVPLSGAVFTTGNTKDGFYQYILARFNLLMWHFGADFKSYKVFTKTFVGKYPVHWFRLVNWVLKLKFLHMKKISLSFLRVSRRGNT